MDNCNHVELKKLGGPIHPSGKDYYCLACGQQFKAEILVIGIAFGTKQDNTQKGDNNEKSE
jgi:hypothetical protein